jgi:surface polysaccharide O-acyltransferase-like enzyme
MPSINWFIAAFSDNFFRIGVDLFLMLSGALSLGRQWEIRSFLGKRLPRIILPFIFWGFVLSSTLILMQYFAPSFIHVIKAFTFENIINYIVGAWRAQSIFTSYWFFWMILGTYFAMPIINKWLLHSDLKEAEYFLIFWLITCIFDYTLKIAFPVQLSFFMSLLGLVVLGYYLRHTKRKIFNNLYFPVLLIILSAVVEVYLSYCFSSTQSIHYFDRYSIVMAVEVIGVFLLFRNLDEKKVFHNKVPEKLSSIFKKAVGSIASYSYGIYLIHTSVLFVVTCFLKYFGLYNRFKLDVFLMFVFGLLICWLIMALLSRVKYVNRVIGAK